MESTLRAPVYARNAAETASAGNSLKKVAVEVGKAARVLGVFAVIYTVVFAVNVLVFLP